MKKLLALLLLVPVLSMAQEISTDFGGQQKPYRATIIIESVDLETTQNIDLPLPDNFKYVVESVRSVCRTAPSAVTTAGKISISSYDGSTATTIKGGADVLADAAGEISTVHERGGASSGYQYTEDVAAATTTGLCTQNTALNVAGALAGETSPLFPRKLVITTVDNAGDDLAGTVTLTGTNAQGEAISETVTIVAGTDSHTTTSAFATFTAGTFDFGATAEATNDTLDIGMSVQQALPVKNAKVYKILTAGVADTVAAEDAAEGTFSPTDAADGATEQEIYYREVGTDTVIDGANQLRVGVTGSTVTGSDVHDLIIEVLKY